MDDLLDLVTMEDLRGGGRELAEVVGLEGFKSLVRTYGGTSRMYVPTADMVTIPARDTLIRREYDGSNVIELARKWSLSERHIYDIVKEEAQALRRKPIDGQISMFGGEGD
ncbi:hypothetical protein LJC60_09830 [Ruminococcaceae bacterium OttesenSCG-928-D13]|nr:hypothetical protein [Ruminococcaceae bacterium OttesenSCG-928-D13]